MSDQPRYATDEEFKESAQRVLQKHRPSLEKLATHDLKGVMPSETKPTESLRRECDPAPRHGLAATNGVTHPTNTSAHGDRSAVLRELLERILVRITSARMGSIGSMNNVYLPQIGVDEVTQWKAELTALLTAPAQPSVLNESYTHGPFCGRDCACGLGQGPTISDVSEQSCTHADSSTAKSPMFWAAASEKPNDLPRTQEPLSASLTGAAPAQPSPAWQSIETMPRDGRRVLLFGVEFHRLLWGIGYYWKGVAGDGEGIVAHAIHSEPEDDFRGFYNPTHWMPLPSPPVLTGAAPGVAPQPHEEKEEKS